MVGQDERGGTCRFLGEEHREEKAATEGIGWTMLGRN